MSNKWGGLGLIIVSSLLLGGCGSLKAGTTNSSSVEEARPTTSFSGTVVVTGGTAVLLTVDKQNIDLESRKVDLDSYNGKKVTVTGEYSGTTLFVDEIK